MKRITLFLTVCLGLSVFQTGFAVDSETVRAANKRGSVTTVSTNNSSSRTPVSNSKQKSNSNRTENARSTTNKNVRDSAVVQSRTTVKKQPGVKQRSTVTPVTKNVSSRTPLVQTRAATARKPTQTKSITTRSAVNQSKTNRGTGRAAELNNEKIAAIKSKDYSKCKEVYQECMDEFCANKDTTLRRCACSSRIHEFDDIKKQLSDVEEQMLEFNQRLLTVGMDKEDALAINTATEGEEAFSKTDSSESEKLLQKITKTLNSSGDSKVTNDLSSISLELDMDSVWDSVDSLANVATTAKSGLDLYNAAQPVCVEMAHEVCSAEELEIAESSYRLSIQNDCNTVSKAYNTKYNKAMDKIHESGALLDMARLNAYQQRNSDDILTCKKKMLDQLSDTSVCGENLQRCLDITGQYIDPSTGNAFLSVNLLNITQLLTRPTNNTKWSKVSNNKDFVNFLNSKKAFIEAATEQCQDSADTIWNDFLEDALAQIKLAQNAKVEEIRRNCITLIAECKNKALTDLEDFDVRALSVFAVAANKTANAMCEDIQNSCIALVDSEDWADGVAGVVSDITNDQIWETCKNIGQTCITQKCKGTTGNFVLCEQDNKHMRQSILNGSTCWKNVLDCVAQASNIDNPTTNETFNLVLPTYNYDTNIYNFAHAIWGDCNEALSSDTNNTIKESDNFSSSLLAWFAGETTDHCAAPECDTGYGKNSCDICRPLFNDGYTSDNTIITIDDIIKTTAPAPAMYYITTCEDGCNKKDNFGNCCLDTKDLDANICVPGDDYHATLVQTVTCNANDNYYCADNDDHPGKKIKLYCVTSDSGYPQYNSGFIDCGSNGYWVLVDDYGNYFNPATQTSNGYTQIYDPYKPVMSYSIGGPYYCSTQYSTVNSQWADLGADGNCAGNPLHYDRRQDQFMITY